MNDKYKPHLSASTIESLCCCLQVDDVESYRFEKVGRTWPEIAGHLNSHAQVIFLCLACLTTSMLMRGWVLYAFLIILSVIVVVCTINGLILCILSAAITSPFEFFDFY